MKFTIKFAIVAATALAAMACGNKSPEQAAQDVKNQIAGTNSADVQTANYKGSCHLDLIPTLATNSVEEYDLSPGHFIKKTFYYNDTNCNTEVFVVQQSGDLIDQGSSPTVGNARMVKFNISSVTLLPVSQHAVDEFNTLGVCGAKSWTMNNQIDVSAQRGGLTCPGKGVRTTFDTMLIDSSNHLFLGADAEQVDQNARPAQVDQNNVFNKQ